ncbi:sirohydrochlorin cobaltochelatase [Thiovibrio sp. JS02]
MQRGKNGKKIGRASLWQAGVRRYCQALIGLGILLTLLGSTGLASAMTRTLKSEPAIVLVAFGTTTSAQVTYDFFEEQLKKSLPAEYRGFRIEWAFTSEIVRERANRKFKEQGQAVRYRSLPQVLADLEDEGFRKVAIQSLHIFPGQEYEDLEKEIAAFRTLGMRIEYGGTLLHEWPWVFAAVSAVEKEFLSAKEGCNVLVVHGTPETFPGSNSTYLGLERYLSRRYKNVFVGGVDGILTREQALAQAKAYKVKKVRMIPFMYVAGDHIMNDIMGSKVDEEGVPSWAMELRAAGMSVDTPKTVYREKEFFKGLGFSEQVNAMFIRQLLDSIERILK